MKWYVSTLVAVVAIVLGHFYFLTTTKVKDPTFIVHPYGKQEIVSQEVITIAPLRITKADGSEIKGSVYSETFYFFNQGNDAIKSEHVLEPVSLYLTDTTSEIIDFKILKVTRSVTGLRVVPDSVKKHKASIEFKILEEDDGFLGQVIYSSTSNPVLQIEGAIEGAPKGFSDHHKGDFGWFSKITFSTIFAFLVMVVAVVVVVYVIKYVFKAEHEPQPEPESDFETDFETVTTAKKTLRSALTTRYQLIIRNEENFAEKTSLGYTYSQLIGFSFLLFIAVFALSLFLVETVLEKWFDPRYIQPKAPAIDLPETLLFINQLVQGFNNVSNL